jgi:hypothetical protein
MVSFVEHDPALLFVTVSTSEVVLRIDTDVFASDVSTACAVRIIRCSCESLSEVTTDELLAATGNIVHVSIHREESPIQVELHVNFSADPVLISCSSVAEECESYTSSDLAVKVDLLARPYCEAADAYDALHRTTTETHTALLQTLNHEITVAERKRDFFHSERPALAASTSRLLRLLQRIRSHIDASE